MPLGPLGVTALLAALDWGAWDWATNSNHTTVGLIAGLLMAPIAVAFTWSLLRVLIALARVGLQRLGAERRVSAVGTLAAPASDGPFDIEAQGDRIAA
jgi:TRAP-type C4-dicarboxylate transport system permease small subunit